MPSATSPTEARKARVRGEAAKAEAEGKWSEVVEVASSIDSMRVRNEFSARLAALYRGE